MRREEFTHTLLGHVNRFSCVPRICFKETFLKLKKKKKRASLTALSVTLDLKYFDGRPLPWERA